VLVTGEGDLTSLDFEVSYRGRDGVRAFMQTYQDAFGDSAYEPQWIVDLGGDVFVMLLHHSLRGRASGAPVEQMSAHRVELRDGLVVREVVYSAPRYDWASLAHTVGLDPAELARRQRKPA
jgi:ketosteroid isomerase-like protein